MASLYFTPCPNDTFALAALLLKKIPCRRAWNCSLHDIETLNSLAKKNDREAEPAAIFKISSGALLSLKKSLLLPCGMAFTEKAGPLLVARPEAFSKERNSWKILTPGESTTASILARKLLDLKNMEVCRYDLMIPKLKKAEADAALLIHESRFTYHDHGLSLVEDLGALWKKATGLPLVLAVLVCHRTTDPFLVRDFVFDFRASLDWAWKHREEAQAFSTQYAVEKELSVLQAHLDHFVTKRTKKADSLCFQSLQALGSHAPSFHFCHTKGSPVSSRSTPLP